MKRRSLIKACHFAVDTAGSRRLENGTSTPAYGSTVQGFACDGLASAEAEDISRYGG